MVSFTQLALLAMPILATLAIAKPEQIRGVREPIYHLYLQSHPDDPTIPVLGPEDQSEYFEIEGTIKSTNTSMYLNIDNSGSQSYKTLTFAEEADTDAWTLEGDTIITGQDSSFGRQLNFLVCKMDGQHYNVYLQTGADEPTGEECGNFQTLHLPCLC